MKTLTLFTEYQGKLATVLTEAYNYHDNQWQDGDTNINWTKII